MQNKKTKPQRFYQKPLVWILFLVLVLVTNGILCFLLTPYKSSSQEMWENYKALAGSSLDTIIVGTSEGLSGVNPQELDAESGFSSYNMSTNMQSPVSSLQLLRTAAQDHEIRNCILVIDHEILHIDRAENKRAEQALWRARALVEGFPDSWRTAAGFVFDPDFVGTTASLTWFTPWVYNRSSHIGLNVREKLSGEVLDSAGHRLANGYEPDDAVVDQSIHFVTWEEAAAWDEENKDTVNFQELSLSQENRKALEEMAAFCQKEGIHLYPIVAPYPNFLNIYRLKDYQAMHETLSTLFAAYGFTYYDFNLIRPEYLSMQTDEFKDVGHLNSKGAEKFSAFLGGFLRDEGKDKTFMFYK